MDQSKSTLDWIGEYLDWTQPDGWAVGARSRTSVSTAIASPPCRARSSRWETWERRATCTRRDRPA